MRTLIAVLVIGGLAVFGLVRLLEAPPASPASPAGDATRATERATDAPSNLGAVEAVGEASGEVSSADANAARRSTPATHATASADGASYEGRIVGEFGQPLPGADVQLVDPSSSGNEPLARAETGPDGHFRLDVLTHPGRRQLAVRARGYRELDRELDRELAALASRRIDLGNTSLVRGAIIAGRVVDPSGQAVAAASVHLLRPEGGELEALGFDLGDLQTRFGSGQVTDAAGRFEFAHEPAGAFELRAVHAGYPTARLTDEAERPGDDREGLELRFVPGASIRGVVSGRPADHADTIAVTARTSSPTDALTGGLALDVGGMLEEVGLGAGERTVAIDDDGSFALEGLEPDGRYRLWAVTGGTEPHEQKSCSEAVEARAGEQGVRIVFDPGESLVFDVVDARTRAPISELAIDHEWALDAGWVVTGATPAAALNEYPDGHVAIEALRPPGGHRRLKVSVDALGYERLRRTVDVRRGSGPIELGTLDLQPVPLVRVTVVEDGTGHPIAGARVSLSTAPEPSEEGAGDGSLTVRREIRFSTGGAASEEPPAAPDEAGQTYRATTAADGTCLLSSLPGRTATLRVSAKQRAPFETALELSPVDDRAIDVRLLRGGRVAVGVVDARGRPLADVPVEHRFGPRTRNRTTAGDGHVEFEALAPGSHSFRVAPSGNGSGIRIGTGTETDDWTYIDIADGERATLELVEPLRGALAGSVAENGVPLANATISLIREPDLDDENPERRALEQALASELGGLMALAGPRTRTDHDGRYRLEGVATGRYTLRVEHADRALPQTSSIDVREGENEEDVALIAAVLRGRVVTVDGEPVRRARVMAELPSAVTLPPDFGDEADLALVKGLATQLGGGSRSVTTDADGVFELRGISPETTLVVTVSARGHVDATTAPLAVAADEVRVLDDVVLIAAGHLRVEAESTSGAPLPASASAHWAGASDVAEEPAAELLKRGRALFRNLRPGPWRVRVGEHEELVDVAPGETAEVFVSF